MILPFSLVDFILRFDGMIFADIRLATWVTFKKYIPIIDCLKNQVTGIPSKERKVILFTSTWADLIMLNNYRVAYLYMENRLDAHI